MIGKAGRDKIGEGGGVNRETIESFGGERGSWRSNDGVSSLSFPSIVEELMENGGFDCVVRGKNGDWLVSGAEDFMDKMGNGGFASGAGNADEFEVARGVSVV